MGNNGSRNFGLDLMRVIAISAVLLYHWLVIFHWFDFFYFFGFIGVEIFFVLSGFLIGNILIKSYLNENYFGFKVVSNFWSRRWLRTLPLYLFILLIQITVFFVEKLPIHELWKYPFFLQNLLNYDPNNHDFYGVSWSLSIEEWFYLSFPLVLMVLNLVLGKLLNKVTILFTVVGIFILGSLFIRLYIDQNHSLPWNNQFRKAVICREDSIAFGVMGALVNNICKEFLKKWRFYLGLVGLLLFCSAATVFLTDVASNYSGVYNFTSDFSKIYLFTLTSLSVSLMLPFFYYCKVNNQWFIHGVTEISKISYSLYLVHPFILKPITMVFNPYKNKINLVIDIVLLVTITLAISLITNKFVEQTFLDLRDKFFREKYKPT